jgi:aspartate aminotransferase-like enzyme
MNDDYFTKLDEQLSALTSEGAHLDRWARWRPLDRVARRTVAALGLVMFLAALLVVEFPGSASGSEHRATAQAAQSAQTAQRAQSAHTAQIAQASAVSLANGPTARLGRLA